MAGRAPRIDVRSAGDRSLEARVAGEQQAAARIAESLCSLLDVDLSDQSFTVLLVPFMPLELSLDLADSEQTTLLRMVGPDGDAPPLPLLVCLEIVRRAFGDAEPIVSVGLAGVVAGRTATGPAPSELLTGLRKAAEDQGVQPAELLASAFAEESSELGFETYAAATCFVEHLIDNFGATSVRDYLSGSAQGRQDEASTAVFGRPLAQLVREWSTRAQASEDLTGSLRALWRHIKPIAAMYRWRFVELMTYVLVGVVYTVVLPLTTKYFLDTVLPQRDNGRLVIFIAALLAAYIYRSVLGIRTAYVSALLDQRLFFGLQQRMFVHIQRLSHDFHDRTSVGDLMSRMSNDLSQGQQAFSRLVVTPVPAVLNLTAALVTLFVLDWRFGLLTLAFIPVLVLIYRVLGPRVRATSLRQQSAQGDAMGTLQEAVSAHSALKAFSAERYAERSYASRVDQMFRSGMKMSIYGASQDAAVSLATSLPLLAVLGLGGYSVTQGNMTLGTLVAILGLLPSVVQPITDLSDVFESLQRSTGALHRITELLDEPVTIDDPSAPLASPSLHETVQLRAVSFAYQDGRPALDRVDLTFRANSHTAVVGASGSGKSTLLALLMRFYDPNSGTILMDEQDIRSSTVADLRSQVGLVSQDTVILDATLRENVVLGRQGITDAQIDEAVRAARLDVFVRSLPAGLDTLMGERGARLSGGQRQRIGIARALLRDPVLLLLDEPTSALDKNVEKEVLETLGAVRQGRTTVTVTHRVDTVANADLIVVLADGRVAEQGRHDDLLALNGLYTRLLEQGGTQPGPRPDLSAISLFADVPPTALALLGARLEQRRYTAGTVVVAEGDLAEEVFVLLSGRAEVLTGEAPLQRRLRTLGPGDAFGELALAGIRNRTATVRAVDDIQLAVLPVSAVDELAEDDPHLRRALDAAVAQRRSVYAGAASHGK